MKTHFRVCITATTDEYENTMAHLYSLDVQGCEESNTDDGNIAIKAYFLSEAAAQQAVQIFRPLLRAGHQTAIEPVVNQDWNAKWRQSMQPAKLAPSWWVSPLWLPPPQNSGDRWIKIEPKMAFGTGHHESTRLAAQALIGAADNVKNSSLLDIGTGSGVLCFTGAFLGAARCTGVEIDADCLENLAENRTHNSDAGTCGFIIGSTGAIKTDARFGVIVMNMIHTESAPLLATCSNLITSQGILIWSGILDDEHDAAISAARESKFTLCNHYVENEWWCGVFTIHK